MAVSLEDLPLPDELPAIPDGWRYESLGDLVEERGVSYGIVQPGSESSDGIPIVRVNNIRNGRIDTTDMLKVESTIESKFQRSRLRGGEVLLTLVGTLGEVAIVPENLRGWNVARAVGVIPVRKNPGSLWVSICLRSAFIQHCIRMWATTTVQATFNLRDLAKLPIPIPPTDTREAIASVLGALDDKIELNRRMNATLEAMARALFQSWFVDFDPVRAKLDGRKPTGLDEATAALFPAAFQDSSTGHIPEGWKTIPLYETAQWVNGAAFRSEDFCAAGEGLPVIKIGELKDGISAQTKWSQRQAGPNQVIDTGDLLYSWSGSPDTSLEAFLWCGGRGLLNQHIFKVISPTAAEKRFVYYLLQYLRPVLVETARNKQTTGLGHVTIADMKRLLVCTPNKFVLAAFDRNIAPIFDRAFTNSLEARTLATLRDTLLPKLLSGELSAAETNSDNV
jgi:type I restriction enzyme, S subunit